MGDASAELLDICDAEGILLGIVASRGEAHRLGLWHRTVHVWITTPGRELLIQKRSRTRESHPGLWDASAAGHVTSGDSCVHAALRELREELGINAGDTDLRRLFQIRQSIEEPARFFVDHEVTDIYLLRKSIDLASLKIDPIEVEEVRLAGVSQIRRELAESPGNFVPHGQEYDLLLKEL